MASQKAVVDYNNNVAATSEPWRDELEREISEDAADGEPLQIPSILLGLLTTYPGDDAEAAREAAHRIDAEYREVYIPSGPLLKGLEDKGMAGFLGRVYDLVLSVSRLVDCDDARQDALVRFLGELRKLPPTAFKIWGEDCLVYTEDPVFTVTTEDKWNALFISPQDDTGTTLTSSFKRLCDEWVNFSSFLARCTAEGFYDHYGARYKFPSVDIPLGLGLDGELPQGELGSCRLMVAAQWILHCGGRLRADMAESGSTHWNLGKWNTWVARLREIMEGGVEDLKVKAAVEKALAVMMKAEVS